MLVKKKIGIILLMALMSSICQAQISPSIELRSQPPKRITLSQFNYKVDIAYSLLSTKKLSDISDRDHINIMMCLNTIDLYKYGRKLGNSQDIYIKLEKLSLQKSYNRDILKIYSYVYNTGMGYYFPKLKMALYGTPNDYARFEIIDDNSQIRRRL